MKEVEDFYLLLHPRPAYVIGSGRWGERVNFMAASWVSPVGEEPPSLILALGKESLTLELIEMYEEFTVNIIPISLIEELYYVGSRSGRDEDKSRVFKAERGEKVNAPIVKDSLGVLECKLMKELELGDVKLILGEVLSAKADEKFFNEKKGWDFKRINIPLHNWGRGFFGVGEFMMAKGK